MHYAYYTGFVVACICQVYIMGSMLAMDFQMRVTRFFMIFVEIGFNPVKEVCTLYISYIHAFLSRKHHNLFQ